LLIVSHYSSTISHYSLAISH